MKSFVWTAAAIVAAGWIVQWTVGPFDYQAFADGGNRLTACAAVLLCVAMGVWADSRFVRWFTNTRMAVALIGALAVLGLLMGLTPQGAEPMSTMSEFSARLGFNRMIESWAFVAVWAALMMSLGGLLARRITGFRLRDWRFWLFHAGMWIVMMAAGLGGVEVQRATIRVDEGQSAATPVGHVRLIDFAMETWPVSGKPKRFASTIEINGTPAVSGVVEVNRPLKVRGWWIYQSGYDRSAGPASTYTVLEMVRDPWLWVVYLGFLLIALGSVGMLWGPNINLPTQSRDTRPSMRIWLGAGLVAAIALVVAVMRPAFFARELVPALQSVWFVPHVGVYIFSYALLAVATVMAVVKLITDKGRLSIIDGLTWAGFGLLVLGMLMGAVWAKQAWGHYWEWDPKETWALVTGLAYLIYIHLRVVGGQKLERAALWTLVAAFALLIVTWIGVNYLPSASGSIHVY